MVDTLYLLKYRERKKRKERKEKRKIFHTSLAALLPLKAVPLLRVIHCQSKCLVAVYKYRNFSYHQSVDLI